MSSYIEAQTFRKNSKNVTLEQLGYGLAGPTRINGALCFGERAIYFLCCDSGRLGKYKFPAEFGTIGALLNQFKEDGKPPAFSEDELAALIAQVIATPPANVPAAKFSFVLPMNQITLFKRSMWSGSKIHTTEGKKIGIWVPGFDGQLRENAKAWAKTRSIECQGF